MKSLFLNRVGVFALVCFVGMAGCGDDPSGSAGTGGGTVGAGGGAGPSADFDYSVPARFEVPTLQLPEDQGDFEVYAKGPVHADTWPVQLDACASTGSIVRYSWSVDGTEVGVATGCDSFEYEFPAEGTYSVSLVVEDSDGKEGSHTADVLVRDLLIFGVGDSYGSGEGNPDVVASNEAEAQWQNERCHRSAFSGQVLAAQLIEEADPRSSVTFVHLACSGATIPGGLLGQIERVEEIAGGHDIDPLLVSIGGNDVGFARVIEACIKGEPCYEANAEPFGLPGWFVAGLCGLTGGFENACTDFFGADPGSLDARAIFDDGNDDLPNSYRDLANEIEDSLGMDPERVYLTEYPDVTRDEDGQYCGWDLPPFLDLDSLAMELPGVTEAEMNWSSTYVSAELQATMQAAVEEHGWQFVGGIASSFERHGYCSNDNWLVRLQDSFQIQGDESGVVHPNVAGHEAYAAAIVDAFAP